MAGTIAKSDQDWEAEEDARTLVRVQEIQGNPKRAARAAKALKKQETEAKKALSAVKVARGLNKAIT